MVVLMDTTYRLAGDPEHIGRANPLRPHAQNRRVAFTLLRSAKANWILVGQIRYSPNSSLSLPSQDARQIATTITLLRCVLPSILSLSTSLRRIFELLLKQIHTEASLTVYELPGLRRQSNGAAQMGWRKVVKVLLGPYT